MAKISPMVLAAQLKIRPQNVYGAMRKGRIKTYEVDGKKMIDEAEAKAVLSTPGKRGRKAKDGGKAHGYRATPKVTQGAIASWPTKSGRRVAQVEQPSTLIIGMKDTSSAQIAFRTETLNKLVSDGTMVIEHPFELLFMIRRQFALQEDLSCVGLMDKMFEGMRALHPDFTDSPLELPEVNDDDLGEEAV